MRPLCLLMVASALSAGCIDRGVVGMRDAAAAPGACEPMCAAGQTCLLEEARCVECVDDSDCSAAAAGPHCDLALHACAPCPPGASCAPVCVDDDEDEPFDDDDDCDELDGGDDDDGFPDL